VTGHILIQSKATNVLFWECAYEFAARLQSGVFMGAVITFIKCPQSGNIETGMVRHDKDPVQMDGLVDRKVGGPLIYDLTITIEIDLDYLAFRASTRCTRWPCTIPKFGTLAQTEWRRVSVALLAARLSTLPPAGTQTPHVRACLHKRTRLVCAREAIQLSDDAVEVTRPIVNQGRTE
jgi:hypothetical protein